MSLVLNGTTGITTPAGLTINNAPAFSAYPASAQTVTTNVITKLVFDTEIFDTNSNFASSRFTPTVAGYYQINAATQSLGSAQPAMYIYKNGTKYVTNTIGISLLNGSLQIACLVYCNGSTDYLEIYAVTFGGTQFNSGPAETYFTGSLARAA